MEYAAQLAKELREMDMALRQQVLSHEISQLTVLKLQAERKYRDKASKLLARYSKTRDFLDYFNSRRVEFFLFFVFVSFFSLMNAYFPAISRGGMFVYLWLTLVALSILGGIFLVLAAIIQPVIEIRMPGQLKKLFDISDEGSENLSHEEKLELLARVEVLGGLIGIDYERMKFEIIVTDISKTTNNA